MPSTRTLATAVAAACACTSAVGFTPLRAPLPARTSLARTPSRQQHRAPQSATALMSSRDDKGMTAGGFNTEGEAPFQIRGFSLGNIALISGLLITVSSFADYASQGELSLSGVGFIYGLPVMLIGASLKYAELPPVPVEATEKAEALFETKGSDELKLVFEDVTRHRYGDDAHLDTTLSALGLKMPGKAFPVRGVYAAAAAAAAATTTRPKLHLLYPPTTTTTTTLALLVH